MIPKDDEFRVAAGALRLILMNIRDIEDSEQGNLRFRDPSPNWLTAREVGKTLEFMENGLIALGAVRVRAFSPCGSPEHDGRAVWPLQGFGGVWRFVFEDGSSDHDNFDGEKLRYHGTVLDSDLHQFTCTTESAPAKNCVCARHISTYDEQSTARHFAWPKDPESQLQELARITLSVRGAIETAQPGRPRAAIREHLFEAMIGLERLLVEETAKETIKRRVPDFDLAAFV